MRAINLRDPRGPHGPGEGLNGRVRDFSERVTSKESVTGPGASTDVTLSLPQCTARHFARISTALSRRALDNISIIS